MLRFAVEIEHEQGWWSAGVRPLADVVSPMVKGPAHPIGPGGAAQWAIEAWLKANGLREAEAWAAEPAEPDMREALTKLEA